MNVVFLPQYTQSLKLGGFESQVLHIFKQLKNLGVNVKWYYEVDSFNGVDILQVMSTDPSMQSYITKAKADGVKVVLTPMQGNRATPNWYLKTALAISRIPQLFTPHKLTSTLIKSADFLTPLCSFEADKMVNVYGFDTRKIQVIPNGLEDSFFNDEFESLTLPFEDYYLMVGRIEHNKNQLEAIRAITSLNRNLIIVGNPGPGKEGNDYFDLCKKCSGSNIHFWGPEYNSLKLKTLYKKAKATLIPSYSEMLPLVVFESLSMRTPVVCTNRCGISNDIIPGLIFSDVDANSLVKKIKEFDDFDQQSITSDGIYSWEEIAKQYINVYNMVTNFK